MIVIKVPSSLGSLNKNIGCEKAPDLIVKELKSNFKIDEVKVVKGNLDKTNENIYKKKGDIFIGGDHSITYPLFSSFSKKFKNAGLIIFDAHPDCETRTKTVTHEDFLRALIEDKILDKKNVILIGVRKISKNEFEFIKKNKTKVFLRKGISNNLESCTNEILKLLKKFDAFYLSLDIDVLDPKIAPGTGYLEPDGLLYKELIYILHKIKLFKKLKRVDLVEVNPDKDINNKTVKLASKLISEMFL